MLLVTQQEGHPACKNPKLSGRFIFENAELSRRFVSGRPAYLGVSLEINASYTSTTLPVLTVTADRSGAGVGS